MKKVILLVVLAAVIVIIVVGYGPCMKSLYGAEASKYVGGLKCKACHLAEYKSWEATKHAKAAASLKENEKKDVKCLACHTTGYGKPSVEGAQLEGIQCEACHGSSSEYKNPTIKSKAKWKDNAEAQRKLAKEAGMITTPSKEVCETCHNKNSPTFKEFDYNKALPQVKHKK